MSRSSRALVGLPGVSLATVLRGVLPFRLADPVRMGGPVASPNLVVAPSRVGRPARERLR